MISTDNKKTKGKNIEVWIDPFEWENKELMKEMRKKKTKPNYNMSNRATLEHRSSSYSSCNTTVAGECVTLLYLLAIEKDQV